MHILFLCTGNSCRSIMAEAIFSHFAPQGFSVQSAGSKPTGFVHPKALETLETQGISIENLFSKSWDNLSPTPDIVITLCASAHGETCPSYIGQVIRSHWGMDDPAHDSNPDIAFVNSFNILQKRINAFLALPHDKLINDHEKLIQNLNNIGTI